MLSGKDIDQQGLSSVRSFPTTAYSPYLAHGINNTMNDNDMYQTMNLIVSQITDK